ncbi:MAG: imidazole glycerol phosphate synthase subunit HisH [Woeseia sp.]
MTSKVAIIDSGGANIASLTCALDRLGARSILTVDPVEIRGASHVILPGVGAAADAMRRLRDCGLDQVIPQLSQPVLGICLGMQLLADHSQEDDAPCLGILAGTAKKMRGSPAMPVPNMGWCRVTQRKPHPLLNGIDDGSHFYFIHSYALPVTDYSIAETRHTRSLTAIAASGNFFAAQFHPERSSATGARFLANFLALAA